MSLTIFRHALEFLPRMRATSATLGTQSGTAPTHAALEACDHCPHINSACWSLADSQGLGLLEEYRTVLNLAPGQFLFHEHAPCHGLHCVASGLLALRKSDGEGNSVILRLAHPGEILGFPAYSGHMPYLASAEALQECRICFFPSRLLDTLMDRVPALRSEFARLLALELKGYGEARLHMATRTVETRLLDLLAHLMPSCGRVDEDGLGAWLDLPLARRDLAAMLGVRPETVARSLRHLSAQGLADFHGREVRIPDLRRLRKDRR
jgi:CRP-like cAMP-binding protein